MQSLLPHRHRLSILAAGLLAMVCSMPAHAQDDVVRAGLRNGVLPPESYFRALRENPRAFQFSRAWMDRNPRLRVEPDGSMEPAVRIRGTDAALPLGRSSSGPEPVLGRRDGAVSGTFAFPVVLGYFADDGSAPVYSRDQVQAHFFDGPNPGPGTIRDFYAEVSGGAVELLGESAPWARASLSRSEVTGGVSGLGGASRVGAFIVSVLDQLDDGSIDWGQYDNDGPDGIPNSGDDDGFVDVLAVIHPTAGAECSGAGDRIWSHRWSLWAAAGAPFETSSDRAGGGLIRVNDYTIQPLLDCSGETINDIGVFAHELGHGFGLPDLYCTRNDCPTAGIGEWGLMGSGSWGCRGRDPARPCHMSAWSKAVLGWVEVEGLLQGEALRDVVLEPVLTSGRVLRYDIPGTSEYYLLENRQAQGFDADLHAPGLLVWHVDQAVVDERWGSNRVNADPLRYGVGVIEADNQEGLSASSGNRGDAGDPFPGSEGRTAFHAGSIPAAVSHDGAVSGLTLISLGQAGLDLSFRLSTSFQTLALSTLGDAGSTPLLVVDGDTLPAGGGAVQGAPFQSLEVHAAPGEELSPGVRTPFVSWTDGVDGVRRVVELAFRDTALVAEYGGRQVQVGMTVEGSRFGVVPGAAVSDPPSDGLWFEEGTAVTLTAEPTTGFAFQQWTGALEGAPNPVGLVVEGPVQAGAVFDYTFSVAGPEPLVIAAGDQLSLGLVAENATAPVRWSVTGGDVPSGVLILEFGRIGGTPAETGVFTFTLRARDALGLEGTAVVTMEVGVPDLDLDVLAGTYLENGPGPTSGQVVYLDLSGNRNGRLDLGDVRAHLRRAAQAGVVAPASGQVERTLTLTRVGPGGGS